MILLVTYRPPVARKPGIVITACDDDHVAFSLSNTDLSMGVCVCVCVCVYVCVCVCVYMCVLCIACLTHTECAHMQICPKNAARALLTHTHTHTYIHTRRTHTYIHSQRVTSCDDRRSCHHGHRLSLCQSKHICVV